MVANIGMNGGYPQQFYGVQQPLNQAYGSGNKRGSVLQGLMDKYGCEDCFNEGPYFARYEIPVQQVPHRVIYPTFVSRIVRLFNGG